MIRIVRSLVIAASLLAFGLPAQAQLARTFVSSTGNDANDCSRLTPCRTFQRAHDFAIANGEITVLDPGGYGAVIINRNISIINDGVGEGGLLVSGGLVGITVNAPAGAVVTLRGLTIKGIGFGGGNGIVFNTGAALNVENCTIRNLDGDLGLGLGYGIFFQPDGAAALTVTNTAITDNTANGINVAPRGPAGVTGLLDRVGLYSNGRSGFNISGAASNGGTIKVAAVDTVSANNNNGFRVTSDAGQAAIVLSLFRSVANNNVIGGVQALGLNAKVSVGASMIHFNASGWLTSTGGVIQSYGDNEVAFNAGDQGAMPLISNQ